ncbi:peptidase M24 [Ktedonobacter sp. SOSP1-52]|uniref:M24 family metallopeptidase n=1 Tax=Ktedonobacter sp. SOSP1-52 TaxID=2778366 RepID=UPI0019159E1A|nr:M24 family metallopeptidase [Ktedonobacter sp. SOSP1-52]GHO68505.1 peptidase M24 [Ktedonobacter sp. SOSP1-52]
MDLAQIQQALHAEGLAGWLFYDFRGSNPIAYKVLSLSTREFYSRRWFYFIPAQGEPTACVSSVESHVLRSLPGKRLVFRTWQELEMHLGALLPKGGRIAMEYSPRNAIPYISRVDAGTIELVRACGVEVVSSADLAQYFVARLTEAQVRGHREAGRRLIAAKDQLLAELGQDLRAGRELHEYGVQQRFVALMRSMGIQFSGGYPIVAVNGNASNPHYAPGEEHSSPIRRGDLLLLDFWGTLEGEEDAVFGDYTWMAFAGSEDEIPQKQREVFEVVRQARDSAIAFIRERLVAGTRVEGREVDDVARNVIAKAGYGDYFVHRTGHSITTMDHGDGANNDNFESMDSRALLAGTCCSIEPGIYLPEFGVRSEVDLLIHEHDVEVTGVPAQERLTPLL